MDWNGIVGRNVRKRREALALSQEELADKADVSARYIGSVERGKQSATVSVLSRIAQALDVTPASLLEP